MSDAVLLVCPHCTAVNRVPSARLADDAQCGRCHTALFSGHPTEVSGQAFETHLQRSELPLVVDFWAPWCGPCRMMAPHFATVAGRLEPRARFLKLNTEEEQAVAARFAIRSIPTLAIFQGGREIARQAGAMDAAHLERWILSHLPR